MKAKSSSRVKDLKSPVHSFLGCALPKEKPFPETDNNLPLTDTRLLRGKTTNGR